MSRVLSEGIGLVTIGGIFRHVVGDLIPYRSMTQNFNFYPHDQKEYCEWKRIRLTIGSSPEQDGWFMSESVATVEAVAKAKGLRIL